MTEENNRERIAFSPSPVLLRRSKLLPGESLISLLVRLSIINHYTSVDTLFEICINYLKEYGIGDNIEYPLYLETLNLLEDLTGINQRDLVFAIPQRFAKIMVLDYELFLKAPNKNAALYPAQYAEFLNFRHELRPVENAQYCPLCIQDAAYHRLIWTPILVSICVRHQCLLVDQCSSCQNPIHVQSIVYAHCTHCEYDLKLAETRKLNEDNYIELFSQRTIQSWLLAKHQSLNCSGYQDPCILYQIIRVTWSKAISNRDDAKRMYAMADRHIDIPIRDKFTRNIWPPDMNLFLFTTAFQSIVNWPFGFSRFYQEYALEQLHNWHDERFNFACEAYDNLIDVHSPLMTIDDACEYLDILRNSVLRLIRLNIIEKSSYTKMFSSFIIYMRRTDVLRYKRRIHDKISVQETAILLGLSPDTVVDLVRLGLLKMMNSLNEIQENDWEFTRQAVMDSFALITRCSKIVPGHWKNILDISAAKQILADEMYDIAEILYLMASRQILGYFRSGGEGIGAVLFQTSSINIEKDRFSGNGINRIKTRRIRTNRLAKLMKVTASIIEKLARENHLWTGFSLDKQYIYKGCANIILDKYLTYDTIAKHYNIEASILEKWIQKGISSRILTYYTKNDGIRIFLRAEIERLIYYQIDEEEEMKIEYSPDLQEIIDLIRSGSKC